jgi:hypothetical protein
MPLICAVDMMFLGWKEAASRLTGLVKQGESKIDPAAAA